MQPLQIETVTQLAKLLGTRCIFLLLALCITAPILISIASVDWKNFTLGTFLSTGLLIQPLVTSVQQIAVALLISLFVGNIAAWILTHYHIAYSRLLMGMQFLPLLLPTFAIGYIFDPLLSQTGLSDGVRLGIYSAINAWPLVFLIMHACFANHNAEYWYAAQSLGNNAYITWWRLSVLLNRPVIVAIILLVIMQTLSDVATPSVLGIANLTNLAGNIDIQQASPSTISLIGQLCSAILLLLLLGVSVERVQRGNKRFVQSIAGYKRQEKGHFSNFFTHCIAFLWVGILPLIFGLAPFIVIFDQLSASITPFIDQFDRFGVSVLLALCVALLSVVGAAVLIFGLRLQKNIVYRLLTYIASVGMVVPAIFVVVMISVMAMTVETWFSPLVQGQGHQTMSIQQNYALGVYVLVFRYSAVGILVMQAALAGIDRDLWRAATSLGTSNVYSFFAIEIRLIMPFSIAAIALVAMLTLHDSAVALVIFSSSNSTLVAGIVGELAKGNDAPQALLLLALATALALAIVFVFAKIGLRK